MSNTLYYLNKLWLRFPALANVPLPRKLPVLLGNPTTPVLKTFSIATTNICNAKCVFCAYPKSLDSKGVMSDVTFENALELLKSYGSDITYVDFTPTVGDPLIDPKIVERVERVKKLGYKTTLTTNCILLTAEVAKKLLLYCDEIYISIPSLTRDDYAQVYGVDKQLDVFENLSYLIFAKLSRSNTGNCKIHIRFRNKLKPSEIIRSLTFQSLACYFGKDITFSFTSSFDNWGGAIVALPKGMKLRTKGSTRKIPCKGMGHVSVLHDGTLRACGCRFIMSQHDSLVIGHVTRTDKFAVRSELERLSRSFVSGERPATCKDCSFYDPAT